MENSKNVQRLAKPSKTDWFKEIYLFYTQLAAGSLLIIPAIVLPLYYKSNILTEEYMFFLEFLGMLAGSLWISGASDRIGRKPALALSIALYSAGSFIPFIDRSFYALILSMLIMGSGIGANVPVANAMMNEFSEPSVRGTVMSIGNAIFNFGFVVAPILIFFFGVKFIFIFGILQLITLAPILRIPETKKPSHSSGFRDLYRGEHLKKTLVISFATFFVFFVVYGIVDWFPTLLSRGLVKVPAILQKDYILITNFGAFLGALFIAPLVDRTGRRTLGIAVSSVAGITEVLTLLFSRIIPALAVALTFVSLFFMEGSLAIVTIMASELYDNDMRGRGLGNSLAWGRIGGMTSPLVLGSVLEIFQNPSLPFIVLGLSSVCAAALLHNLPETMQIKKL
ncbi:MAG: MFS transporter [Nitrososphaeria archaeon]|jgi:MFS family permease